MPYLAAYAVALIVFLILDNLWLRAVTRPMLRRQAAELLRERPREGIAIAFHVFYVAVVLLMAVFPALLARNWLVAPLYGVFLGLLAYGTWQSRNLATLRGWSGVMTVVDTAWGATLTALTATAAYFAAMAAGA